MSSRARLPPPAKAIRVHTHAVCGLLQNQLCASACATHSRRRKPQTNRTSAPPPPCPYFYETLTDTLVLLSPGNVAHKANKQSAYTHVQTNKRTRADNNIARDRFQHTNTGAIERHTNTHAYPTRNNTHTHTRLYLACFTVTPHTAHNNDRQPGPCCCTEPSAPQMGKNTTPTQNSRSPTLVA
jgi:hypothetical protein